MKILVCGGRDFSNVAQAHHALALLHKRRPVSLVIEGGARGADRIGREWAERNDIPVRTFPADWSRHGRAAGHIRNKQMLDEGQPEMIVVFPGGRGTANMIAQAKAAGVRTWIPFGAAA